MRKKQTKTNRRYIYMDDRFIYRVAIGYITWVLCIIYVYYVGDEPKVKSRALD